MPATGNTPRVRPWADWLLFLVGIVVLCVVLDLVADAAYRGDGSVLYWLLVAYSYPDGAPIATVIGLVILALALIAYWVSLRLLAGSGLTPLRSFAIVTLAALATVTGIVTLIVGPLINDGSLLFSWVGTLGFALLTLALIVGLGALVRGPLVRRSVTTRATMTLLGLVALTVAATVSAISVAPVALVIGERPINYDHLASASFQDHRYYLALERKVSGGAFVDLFRCDSLGVWCRKVDRLSTTGDEPSEQGQVTYNPATSMVTANEGEHVLLTYAASDLFGTP